jgi:hypothetical protein
LFAALEAAAVAGRCQMPAAAGPAASPATAATEPAVGRTLEDAAIDYAGDAAADAAALSGWQSFYADLQARYGH